MKTLKGKSSQETSSFIVNFMGISTSSNVVLSSLANRVIGDDEWIVGT